MDFSEFLLSEEGTFSQDRGGYFLLNGFGKYVLKRRRIINEVFGEIRRQLESQPGDSVSIYLSGCRGMGKTSDLMLIAKELSSKGWEVYFF